MFIQNVKVKLISTTYKWNLKNYNGGLFNYLKLYFQSIKRISNLQLRFKDKFSLHIKCFFQAAFKPLLWFFHIEKNLHFTVNQESKNQETTKNIIIHNASGLVYFLRIIPIWYFSRNYLTNEEIESIK